MERRKVGTQMWQRCNAEETSVSTEITICNFTEEASYQFRISAINDFGQSAYLDVPGSFYLGEADVSVINIIHGFAFVLLSLSLTCLSPFRAHSRNQKRPD